MPVAVKLYVSPLPAGMQASNLKKVFSDFGEVADVHIFPHHDGSEEAGGFVVMDSKEAAERAINALHLKLIFHPNVPLHVRYAFGENGEPKRKIFVGSLPNTITPDELSTIFSRFGEIEEIHCMGPSPTSNECCAFVRFVNADSATKALSFNGNCLFDSKRRVLVKYANNEQSPNRNRKGRREEAPPTYVPWVMMNNSVPPMVPWSCPWGVSYAPWGWVPQYQNAEWSPYDMPAPEASSATTQTTSNDANLPTSKSASRSRQRQELGDAVEKASCDGSQSECMSDADTESEATNSPKRERECAINKVAGKFEWGLDEDSWLISPQSKENALFPCDDF